jgi:ribonuclease Y
VDLSGLTTALIAASPTTLLLGILVLVLALAGVALLLALRAALRGRTEAREEAEQLRRDRGREIQRRLRKKERNLAARLKAKSERREAELRARAEAQDARAHELDKSERRLEELRSGLDRRTEEAHAREARLDRAREQLDQRETEIAQREEKARDRLEQVAGLTHDQARQEVIQAIETEARQVAARRIARIEEEAQRESHRRSVTLVTEAIESIPGRVGSEATVSVFRLPSDEMKGRVIGREGRNIRAIETTTGVDIIVDDTPSAILLSSFDPGRRELARRALVALIEDGRVHPARIEEVVERTQHEMDEQAFTDGEAATFELELPEVHSRLCRLVGRMKYLSIGGQSLLDHSRETALLAGYMGAQLGLRAELARRAGLFHEVARSLDTPPTEAIPTASADLVVKYGESADVADAIRGLSHDTPSPTPEALLLTAAKRLSQSRPGARRDNLQIHVERLSRYEKIARSFPGVKEAFAVKAGRELRVMLRETETTDEEAVLLARQIAQKIQAEVAFPGQVKVSVIRETRAIDYAM